MVEGIVLEIDNSVNVVAVVNVVDFADVVVLVVVFIVVLVVVLVVVVVGGMGSLGGAVAAGFLLGILQSFASMNEVKAILPGIDQIIIYLIAVALLLPRPRGLMGRKGVMED